MNKEQFKDGINFFYDPVTMSIDPNVILVFYNDKDIEPRVMSANVYAQLYENTAKDKNKLEFYKIIGGLSNEQMEEMGTLENKLRVLRGEKQGDILSEDQFNCPITRSTLSYGNFQNAENLLEFFIYSAFEKNFSSPEMDEFLAENEWFLEKAANSYIRFMNNEIKLEEEQLAVLKKFGVDCPIKIDVEVKKETREEEENTSSQSSIFAPIWQITNLLSRRNMAPVEESTTSKRQKPN